MAQLIGLGIENFRIFKEATEFDFAPLTLLTGANNSGKSSLIKALLLLADNADKNNVGDLDFSGFFSEIHNLATFDLTLNNENIEQNNNIKFELFYEIEGSRYKLLLEYEKHLTNSRLLYFSVQRLNEDTNIYFLICGIRHEGNHSYSSFLDIAYFIQEKFKNLLSKNDYFEQDNTTALNLNIINEEVKKIVTHINPNLSNEFLDNLNKYTVRWLSYTPNNVNKLDIGHIYNQLHYEKISAFAKLATIGNFPYIKREFLDNKDYQPFFEALSTFSLRDILKKEYAEYLLEIPNDAFLFIKTLRNQITFEYEGAIRANSKRLYKNIWEGTAFNGLLNRFNKMYFSNESKEKLFIKKWLKNLGIADDIQFIWDEQVGTRIRLYCNNKELDLTDLGFGVTQLLPILIHIVICKTEYLIIEEPENSLHPDFQSELADLFVDAYQQFKVKFILETHSEYFIRKLQVLTKKGVISPKDSVIYYENSLPNSNLKINIGSNGILSDELGNRFVNESNNLVIELYELPN